MRENEEMCAFEIGRICVKTSGREAKKKCVIVNIIDKSFVLITGPKDLTGVKRRRANVNHLKATDEVIKINRDATDKEITQILKETNKLETLKTDNST
jgi:large subunit ribosomal protein L14e